MPFLSPPNAENVALAMAAAGLIGSPGEFVFDKSLTFPAASAADVVIGTLGNPVAGETLSFLPADGRIKWVGSVLKTAATPSTAATRYYVLTRTKDGLSFSQTVAIQAV